MPKGKLPEMGPIRINRTSGAIGQANDAAAKQIKETMGMMYNALQKGIMPKQMLNIGDDTIEGLYAQAYNLYNAGKYQDASYLFLVLMMLDPNQPKHLLGSAACLHRMGKYEKAGQIYILCSSIDPSNPLPHFHAADCYIKLKALPLAHMCLKNTIQCCADKKEFAVIKERATAMLEVVVQEVEAMGGFPGIGSRENEEVPDQPPAE